MKYILITILSSILLFASSLGDVDKGHTYFRYIINPIINVKGDMFTIKHTKKEWEDLFSNNAQGFKSKYSTINDDFKKFLSSEKFDNIALDLKAFFIYYAKDSDIKPQCGE
ncbi:hypothetical protein [Arcobacter sp. LA11]|uniref:hypothetical protein n=1 Tax=Arcobacter sp. LA11 TaxID=1898176 RepID=UPI0009327598|nr:hypothetical protein [Arcobacter sp. LA11]